MPPKPKRRPGERRTRKAKPVGTFISGGDFPITKNVYHRKGIGKIVDSRKGPTKEKRTDSIERRTKNVGKIEEDLSIKMTHAEFKKLKKNRGKKIKILEKDKDFVYFVERRARQENYMPSKKRRKTDKKQFGRWT